MRRFIIEREIPDIGKAGPDQLKGAAGKSNEAVAEVGKDIQWVRSYVAANKTFCVYLAASEDAIRRHAELAGFPANTITEVDKVIDPTTAG